MEDFNYNTSPAFIIRYDKAMQSINAYFSFPYYREATNLEIRAMEFILEKFKDLAESSVYEMITPAFLARFKYQCQALLAAAYHHTSVNFELEAYGFDPYEFSAW